MGLKPGDREYNADTNRWEVKKVKPVAKPANLSQKRAAAAAPKPKAKPKASNVAPVPKTRPATMGGKGAMAGKSMADALTKKKPLEITVKGGNKPISPMGGKGALAAKSMADALKKK